MDSHAPSATPRKLARELILFLLEHQHQPTALRMNVDSLEALQAQFLQEWKALQSDAPPPWTAELGQRAASLGLVGSPAVSSGGQSQPLQQLAERLIALLRQRNLQPAHLQPQPESAEALELACLQEAIHLREAGEAQASLDLLEQAHQAGLRSGWVHDNRARALAALQRNEEALTIWQELCGSDQADCAAAAREMVEILENSLLQELQQLCRREGFFAQHLESSSAEGSVMDRALHQVIACRDADRVELSLALAEKALALGWRSPWMRDNQARALVHLDRIEEAVAIWSELSQANDPGLAAMAHDMLTLYGEEGEKRRLQREVRALLQKGEAASAKELILHRLLQQPASPDVRALLVEVLAQLQPSSGEATPLLQQELREPTLRLEAHACLLEALERELLGEVAAVNPA